MGDCCNDNTSDLSNYIITLNIGGTEYTTLRSTLQKYPCSLLGAMFSEDKRFSPPLRDRDNRVFIDRDGPSFQYILNFMRCDRLCLPVDFKDYDILEAEADYFQILPLIEAVRLAKNVDTHITPLHYIEITEFQQNNFSSDMLSGNEVYNLSLNNKDSSNYSISFSGAIEALITLPFPDRIIKDLSYFSGQIYKTIKLTKTMICKMAVMHHLQLDGWTMASSTLLNDTQHSYMIQKYIWTRPIPNK